MINYILRTILIILISTPIYLAIRRPWRFKDKREIALGIFVVYLICLFAFTLEGTYQNPIEMIKCAIENIRTGQNINYHPFLAIKWYFTGAKFEDFLINIVSNIAIFIPWGFLLPTLWEKFRNPKRLLFMCIGLTCFIEFCQLFIGRNTDIDDIMLNTLGSLIGTDLFQFVQFRKNKRKF